MKNFTFLITLLFSIHINAQHAKEGNSSNLFLKKINFEHYGTKQGLSQNSVYSILQDNKGFLWFGTQDGLNRFNGYEFAVFRHDAFDSTSLCHSFINKIFQDSKNRIWVCTEGGLALYNPLTESFTNFTHDDSDPKSIQSNYVWTIFEDRSGGLWVGTRIGLNHFDPDKQSFESVNISASAKSKTKAVNVDVIVQDKNSHLWIGTRGDGLYKITRDKDRRLIYRNYNVGNNDVRSIIDNSSGVIYAATFGEGLYRYDSVKDIFNRVNIYLDRSGRNNPKTILELFIDPANPDLLWLGTEEDGIIFTDTKKGKTIAVNHQPDRLNSLSGNMVYKIYRDRSEIIWIGTNEGISKINPAENRFEHFQWEKNNPYGLSHNATGKIIEDQKGVLWIGTDGGGLNKFNRTSNEFTHFISNSEKPSSLSSNRAMIVFEDHSGTLWVGTFGGGLNRFIAANGSFESYTHSESDPYSIGSDYITSIVEDNSGYLWIGTTTGGINRFDPKTKKFKRFLNDPYNPKSLSGNHIWTLCIDKAGVLWAGTKSGGLNELIDPEKGIFRRYLHNNKNIRSINHNTVHAIFEDSRGGLWIGTPGGLNKLDRSTGLFTDLHRNGVFPQFRVIGIMEDNHNRLWFMSEKALIRFNTLTNETKYYDSGNGMPVNDFRIWANFRNKNGEMFAGGANGFVIYNPDNFKDNSFIPPVVIDKITRFNTDDPTGFPIEENGIAYRDNINLSYKDNIFTISFAALNYINSGKNQYAYKLEGFNKDWIKIGSRRDVTFTNIDPGSYTLKVRGSNDDGVWNDKGASIGIFISPPFWITWWFRSGIFVIIVFTIGSFILKKLKAAERHHRAQEAFSRQLIETEELERQRIANELHDSLGQNLLVIKNSLLVKQQQDQIEGKSLEETSELVSQTIQEVRSISHNLRPHLLDQLGITKTIRSLTKQINDSSGISISAEVDDLQNILDSKAEINLFRMVQESFNNIIKHSGATKASLEIKIFPDYLNVRIKDNGRGMNLQAIRKSENYGRGFGLYGMEKRAHLFNWIYEIISSLNRGTEIKLTIPLRRNS